MSTETTNKKIKIDNGTTFGKTYTDKAIDAKLPTDLIASANKLSLGVGNAPLGNGVNLDGFTYDEATKTLKAEGSGAVLPSGAYRDPFIFKVDETSSIKFGAVTNYMMQFSQENYSMSISFDSELRIEFNNRYSGSTHIVLKAETNNNNIEFRIDSTYGKYVTYNVDTSNSTNKGGDKYIPALERPSSDGVYNLQITKNGNSYHYEWVKIG